MARGRNGDAATFPAIDAVVDAIVPDMSCAELVGGLKQIRSDLPVVVVGRPGSGTCDEAEHLLSCFDPALLLTLLRSLQPESNEAISSRDSELSSGGK